MNTELVKQDIWDWITQYVEVDNEFYNYKFPPCPYAKSARLKGLVTVEAYQSGDVKDFINSTLQEHTTKKQHQVCVMALPPQTRWRWGLKKYINSLNKDLIPNDYFIQFGFAVKTQSRYSGFFNSGPYFIVIINKLSDVLSGHESLLKTDYYKNWAYYHYYDVAERRQKLYQKYSKKDYQ